MQRLKDARTEAASDIEALKSAKQAEFTEFEKTFLGSSDEVVGKVTKETDEQLKKIAETFAKNKGKVLEKVLEQVVRVNPEVRIGERGERSGILDPSNRALYAFWLCSSGPHQRSQPAHRVLDSSLFDFPGLYVLK